MSEAKQKPWAYVAHKDGFWAGVASAELSKDGLGEFLTEFVADGFAITTVYDREGYLAFLDKMRPWHESEEWKAKHGTAKEAA